MEYTLETNDLSYSSSKAKHFIGALIIDNITNKPIEGERKLPDGTVMRFKDGYIDGNGEPALEYEDGGVEYWSKGHPDGQPAVIQFYGSREEFWQNGILTKITSEFEIEKLI